MNIEKHIISSEADAFSFLKEISKEGFDAKSMELVFDGWPAVNIRLKGKPFKGTITTDVMKGIIDLQGHLHQAYADIAYNSNIRKLTATDKEHLQLIVEVSEGSSILGIDLEKVAEQFVNGALSKMESKHVFGVVVTAMVLYAGDSYYKAYLNQEFEAKSLETRVQLSQEETARVKLIKEIAAGNAITQQMKKDADEYHNSMLKSLSQASTIEMGGTKILGEQVKDIVKPTRAESNDLRIDEVFKIDVFDAKNTDFFKVHIKNKKGEAFNATMSKKISQKDIDLLIKYFKKRKPIKLQINARKVRDEIKSAVIVGVSKP